MKPNPKFLTATPEFWANIKLISQRLGYTQKGSKSSPSQLKVYSVDEILNLYEKLGFRNNKIYYKDTLTQFGQDIIDYIQYRAIALNEHVETQLMKLSQAKSLFENLYETFNPIHPIPLNKQTGEKKTFSYFTGIINILIEANIGNYPCNYGATELTAFTQNRVPFRSLSRRVDGSFPSTLNPIAMWEIKEYYHTTSFGSRIADGVYETQLDGLELKEVRQSLDRNIMHYLMIDAYDTWWTKGKSYLCRIIDMMHMGLVTEAIFGKEVIDRIPIITKEWIDEYNRMKDFLDGN